MAKREVVDRGQASDAQSYIGQPLIGGLCLLQSASVAGSCAFLGINKADNYTTCGSQISRPFRMGLHCVLRQISRPKECPVTALH